MGKSSNDKVVKSLYLKIASVWTRPKASFREAVKMQSSISFNIQIRYGEDRNSFYSLITTPRQL